MEMSEKIIIENASLKRGWGIGFSTQPTGNDLEIEEPRSPNAYTGTLKQIKQQMMDDSSFISSLQGTLKNVRVFYKGGIVEMAGEHNLLLVASFWEAYNYLIWAVYENQVEVVIRG